MIRAALLVALTLVSAPLAHAQFGIVRPTGVGEISGRLLSDWRQAGTGAATQLEQLRNFRAGGSSFDVSRSADGQVRVDKRQ